MNIFREMDAWYVSFLKQEKDKKNKKNVENFNKRKQQQLINTKIKNLRR